MKKFAILATLFALMLSSCTDALLESDAAPTPNVSLPEFTAEFADAATRTYVEDEKYLHWHESDSISIFMFEEVNAQYLFNGKTGDKGGSFRSKSADFFTGTPLQHVYAIYPYGSDSSILAEGELSVNLPAVQYYAENSFGPGANTMVAVTENFYDRALYFKSIGGYLKLKLYGDATIKTITVKGNRDEKIAGRATISASYEGDPVAVMTDEATTSVMLDCGNGVVLSSDSANPTVFWVVLPEITFEEGITITITDIYDGICEKSTDNEISITRNMGQPMAALSPEFTYPPKPASNEIWYTNGSATYKTTPYVTDVFGANIVSNTYDAEKECWVIKFDGNVTSIGERAFRECSSLTNVTIPDSVTSIGDYAFYNCGILTSISIPDSVTSIGDYAFYNCSLTRVTIPDSVTSIGSWAFCGCHSLTSITIPDSVTEIGSYTFYGCSSLTSITIPDSVTSIGSQAFRSCSSLTSITIPDSVTSIGDYAFSGCSSLTSVTIGDSVTSIGGGAFNSCSSLTRVDYSGDLSAWCKISFGGYSANPCTNGAKLYLNEVELTDITIPSDITEIKNSTFCGCTSITSVNIHNRVTSIGEYAFYKCSSLTSITIPDSVTEIGSYAFRDCSSLQSITIPDSVTEIGSYTFYGCSSLTSITIPDSVTSIGEYAFYGCSSLQSVTIGNSVTEIGDRAFYNCSSLTSVYCKPTTPPTLGCSYGTCYVFHGNASYRKIYVPASDDDSIINAYKAKSYWSKYADDIVEYEF